jgi:hypothetical protein
MPLAALHAELEQLEAEAALCRDVTQLTPEQMELVRRIQDRIRMLRDILGGPVTTE